MGQILSLSVCLVPTSCCTFKRFSLDETQVVKRVDSKGGTVTGGRGEERGLSYPNMIARRLFNPSATVSIFFPFIFPFPVNDSKTSVKDFMT